MTEDRKKDKNAAEEPQLKKTPKERRGKTVLWVFLGILAVLVVAGIAFAARYLGRISRIDPGTQSVISPSELEAILSDLTEEYNSDIYIRIDDPAENSTGETVWQRGKKETQGETVDSRIGREFHNPTEVNWEWTEAPKLDTGDRINILLIGQDTRDISVRQFSDTMLLVSVNPSTHDVAIISFVRDLYVPIHEGYQDGRLNTPYYIGGTEYLRECLEKNFGLQIDGFVIINFGVFRKIVDVLGGIDITLTKWEAENAQDVLNRSYLDMVYWDEAMRELDISLFGSSEESPEESSEESSEESTAEDTESSPEAGTESETQQSTEATESAGPETSGETRTESRPEDSSDNLPESDESSSEAPEYSGESTEPETEGETAESTEEAMTRAAMSLEDFLAEEAAVHRVLSEKNMAAAPVLLLGSQKKDGNSDEASEINGFHEGLCHLNGNEALAYVRMRNQESDLNRTARQRRFMDILFNKMQTLEPSQLFAMLDAILPYITTDLTNLQILNYAAKTIPYLRQTSFTTNRIPADDTYRYVFIRGMSVVQAVQKENLEALAEWLSH